MAPDFMTKDRLEAFSDGVFTVVLTLLVLELHAPNLADHSSLGQYAVAITPLVPKIISFILTFIIICIHWVGHHYFFSHIRRVTIGLLWLNNLFLLCLCFMPFPTAMLGNHPTDQFPVILYGVNQLLAALIFFAFRLYASRHRLFEDNTFAKTMGPGHSIPAIIILTSSILFAFVNVYISLACFVLVPLLYFVPTLISKLRTRGTR